MKLHFIGIGGIGMSGLAAMCRDAGHQISGSDRGAGLPENRHIFSKLETQGITVYPQDGSYINGGKPDFLTAGRKKKKGCKVLGSIDLNLPSYLWEERPLPGHGIGHHQQGSP